MSRRTSRAQSMVEVLVAIIFLAAGGMALYTASQRAVSEAAWGAERVMCEGLLNDLVQYYSGLTYGQFSDPIVAIGVDTTRGEEDANALMALPDSVYAGLSKDIEEKIEVFQPSQEAKDPIDALLTGADPVVEAQKRAIKSEWDMSRKSLDIQRGVFFKPAFNPGGGTTVGLLTCVVRWKSRANPRVSIYRQVIIYNN